MQLSHSSFLANLAHYLSEFISLYPDNDVPIIYHLWIEYKHLYSIIMFYCGNLWNVEFWRTIDKKKNAGAKDLKSICLKYIWWNLRFINWLKSLNSSRWGLVKYWFKSVIYIFFEICFIFRLKPTFFYIARKDIRQKLVEFYTKKVTCGND